MSKRSGYQRKGGTHGSLSKAGKIRDQNKKQWKLRDRRSKERKSKKGAMKGGNLQLHIRKHRHPRTSVRHRYERLMYKSKREFDRMRRGFK